MTIDASIKRILTSGALPLARGLYHALLPPLCLLCGGAGDDGLDLCRGCRQDLPGNGRGCIRCAEPLASPGLCCGRCQRRPPCYHAALAPFRYRPPLDQLIRQLKYRERLPAARLLAALMLPAAAVAPRPQALLAVPLHPSRQRQRGFNQALEIARPLAAGLGLPLARGVVARQRAGPAQSTLPRRLRRPNVRGAFAVKTTPRWRHLALIDDVMTTGSTADELARVLLAAGAVRVDVWVVARTPLAYFR